MKLHSEHKEVQRHLQKCQKATLLNPHPSCRNLCWTLFEKEKEKRFNLAHRIFVHSFVESQHSSSINYETLFYFIHLFYLFYFIYFIF